MNLETIAWPVFRLGEKAPSVHDNIAYYATEYSDLDTNTLTGSYRIVDDKNIPQETLSRRRLALVVQEVKLFPITRAIYFLGDLLKQAKSTTWFIDSVGTIFQYKKSRTAKLLVKKISKILPSTGLGSIIELEGIPQRFKTVFKPEPDAVYAAVLKLGQSYIFYGLYKEKPNESRRLV